MTVAAPDRPWDRCIVHGAWFIPDGSPGGLGEPEVWIDEAALDMYARGDAEPAVTVRPGREPGLIGSAVRFSAYPGLDVPVVYTVTCRRWSQVNDGRPYYVLAWAELPSEARERFVAKTPPETAETRGGADPDWDTVQPGEPLPGRPEPETSVTGEDR